MEKNTDTRGGQTGIIYITLMMFCLPMCYSFWTRYKGKNGVFAWLVKYLVPVATMGYVHPSYSFCSFVIGLLYVYSLYEIGYIQNDCETVKSEKNPTMRLTDDSLTVYESHRIYIYMIRILQILLWACLLICSGVSISIVLYGFLTLPTFLLYNKVRNKSSLFIHLLLLIFRYTVPIVICINTFCPTCLCFIFILYPLTLFVERSVKGKFGYQNQFFKKYLMHDYSERYVFRIKYYSILCVITIVCVVYNILPYIYLLPVMLLLLTSIISRNHKNLHYEKT